MHWTDNKYLALYSSLCRCTIYANNCGGFLTRTRQTTGPLVLLLGLLTIQYVTRKKPNYDETKARS